ncbi:MAG: hypothetical protein ABR964_02085 [Tepidisphaeraceae bacterium]
MTYLRVRQLAVSGLLALGIWQCFCVTTAHRSPQGQIALITVAAGVALIWPSRWAELILDRGAAALARRPALWAGVVGIVGAAVLLSQAWRYHDQLFLKYHDEYSYLIQARMLASGHLWLAPYPSDVAPFFNSFFLIVDRVYASVYFPGTALLTVPIIWIGLPYWVMPLAASAAALGIFYLVTAELFGAVRGLVAVLILLGLAYFRLTAMMLLSEAPALLWQMVLFWAWFRWRKSARPAWALLIGAAAGLYAITRPLDATCFCGAVGIGMLIQLWRQRPAIWLSTAGCILLSAAPFLTLQAVQNVGVTGKWTMSPSAYVFEKEYPGFPIGFGRLDPKVLIDSPQTAKQQWFNWVAGFYLEHDFKSAITNWNVRGKDLAYDTLPAPLVVILIPVALVSLWEMRRAVIVLSMLLFLAAYTVYAIALPHYMVAVMPAMTWCVLMGWESVERAWSGARPVVGVFLLLALAGLSIHNICRHDDRAVSGLDLYNELRQINQNMQRLPITPAVVLFRFDPTVSSFHDEPVYNADTAWPDDAMVVHAHDLGMLQNAKLIEYYAQRQPDRVFYIYDRGAPSRGEYPLSRPMGTARQLSDIFKQLRHSQ